MDKHPRLALLGLLFGDSRSGEALVLARPDGRVFTVDFAGSLWLPPGTVRHRLFGRWLWRSYKVTLHKWRKLLTPGRSSRDEKTALGRFWLWVRMPHRWRSASRRARR